MKPSLLTLCAVLFCIQLHSQNIGINVDGSAPHPSALLDIDAAALPNNAKRGLLIPRVTLVQRNFMATTEGLLVYNTDQGCFNYYDAGFWLVMCGYVVPNSCPSGYIDVNGRFSIEADQRPTATWFDAVTICNGAGGRLCRIDEYYLACTSGNTSIMNLTDGYEWTMDAAAGTTFRIIGLGDCTPMSNGQFDSVYPFRCVCSP